MNQHEKDEVSEFFALLNSYESTTETNHQLREAARVSNYLLQKQFHFLDIKEIRKTQKVILKLLLDQLSLKVEVEVPNDLFDDYLLKTCKYLSKCKKAEKEVLPVLHPLHSITPTPKIKKFKCGKSLRIHVQKRALIISYKNKINKKDVN
eukprot:gene772-9022_t